MIESERTQSPVVVVDGGDLLGKAQTVPVSLLGQAQQKGALMLGAMSLVGLDVWVPGEADWALGRDFVLGLVDLHDVPLVAGNLKCGDRQFPGHRLVERGGIRLGFIGVVEHAPVGCAVSDPAEAAIAAAKALGTVDVLVGIFHGEAQLDGRVLEAVPAFDFFFNGHTGQSQGNPRQVKGGWFLGAGRRGKHMGRLALAWAQDAQPGEDGVWVSEGEQASLEARMVRYTTRVKTAQQDLKIATDRKSAAKLERRITHHQAQADKIRAELKSMRQQDGSSRAFRHSLEDLGASLENHVPTEAMVQDSLKRWEAAVSEQATTLPAALGDAQHSQLPFVGSAACGSCHPAQMAQWKGTGHAHAWATLVDRKRSMDSQCFACHVTGAHHPQGPQTAIAATGLTDVGCEACHGPGAAHIAQPSGTMKAGAAQERCRDCHDNDQDEGRFDPVSYLPRVQH